MHAMKEKQQYFLFKQRNLPNTVACILFGVNFQDNQVVASLHIDADVATSNL